MSTLSTKNGSKRMTRSRASTKEWFVQGDEGNVKRMLLNQSQRQREKEITWVFREIFIQT